MSGLSLDTGGSVKLAGMLDAQKKSFSQELCLVHNSLEYDITKPYKTYSGPYGTDLGYHTEIDLIPLPNDSPLLIDTKNKSMLSAMLLMPPSYVTEALPEGNCTYVLCVAGYVKNTVTNMWHPESFHIAARDVNGEAKDASMYYGEDEGSVLFYTVSIGGALYHIVPPIWLNTLGAERVQVMLQDRRIESSTAPDFSGNVLLFCSPV